MRGLFVFCLCFQAISAVMHSWKAFYTGSTGLTDFPEFVALNLLDNEVMGYFDSRTSVFEAKKSWMMETLGQEYAERQTNILRGYPPTFKGNIAIAMERFNQSNGVHILQWMVGCDWDDEADEVTGYRQDGYDGEDFIAFDLKTGTWIAPKPEAVITKNKLDNNRAVTAQMKNYLTQICPEWLKKYVNYGSRSLLRTDLPSVSLLQKSPSSPVSCHATGFYPGRATVFWRKDGQELHEDVDHGEILHNHDGTFQMKVDLKVSSVKPEDWRRYDCVFQLYGVKDDIITKLDKAAVRTNEGSSEFPVGAVVGVFAVVILLALIAGFFIWKRRNNTQQKGFNSANGSDTSSINEEQGKMLKPTE
uniref:MHC class I antigen n=1 Tax=Channa argus TaxID=215402 RepID=B5APK0_CHAAH|nr:MHC class I antigen [Channa argus]